MQMIQPLHAGAVRQVRMPEMVNVDERVVEIKTRARQQRIVRSTLGLLGSSLLICGLLLWRTDTQRLRLTQQSLDGPIKALQARVDALGWLPASADEKTLQGLHYSTGVADRFYAMHSGRAIVGASNTVPMLLRPNGRFIVWFDHGKLSTQWMTLVEYDAALREQIDDMHALEDRLRSRPPELP